MAAERRGPSAVSESTLYDYGPSLAAAPERGLIGLCYSRGTQGEQSVVFRVLGPDGTPWSAEQTIAEHLPLAAGCTVGWSGSDFIVAWWKAGAEDSAISVARLAPEF